MTKLDQAIEAMSILPEAEREELAEFVIELASSLSSPTGKSALTPSQWSEVERRVARGFRPADEGRLHDILARYG